MASLDDQRTGQYKNTNKPSERQSDRRKALLNEQKQRRQKSADNDRHFIKLVKKIKNKRENNKQCYRREYKNQLQLSEWLQERPDDLNDWYLVPCPKGQRCLLIAHDGSTELFSKSGKLLRTFQSRLPGDQFNKGVVTILDCFLDEKANRLHALDVLVWANQAFDDCTTDLRFFWLRNKIIDEILDETDEDNCVPIMKIDFYDFKNLDEIEECLARHPMWIDNQPALDGFLFYHKDSAYVHGSSPLVGWLFSFMFPEVLGITQMHPEFLKKPDGYENAVLYIEEFNKNLSKRNGKKKNEDCMELEESLEEESLFDESSNCME